eukprot:CAMPEP_0182479078 /NCGR_PEP_ID=MMETSP1319-20130603/33573_1 /TAXON_ID=172717 /ORGANISM="Bolidomonas pacifica, Strain RCC208" /LENGTH=63 /DNA_ID=CAMNT_0024680477 /DNA_START=56 /DNA_END=244 /DNA_ORIENTATION=-
MSQYTCMAALYSSSSLSGLLPFDFHSGNSHPLTPSIVCALASPSLFWCFSLTSTCLATRSSVT